MSITKGMLDIIGGYYFLRDKNLSDMKPGQKLSAKILMDGTIYELWFIVKGFETVESKFGAKKCIRTSLVLPKNNFFEDKDAIRLWISQDSHQIPFKMEVSLKIGFLTIDLEDINPRQTHVCLSSVGLFGILLQPFSEPYHDPRWVLDN